jgi:hypothetical protein
VDELDLVAAFLDVGHGDAIVLRFRERGEIRTVIVDGGGPSRPGHLLDYLLRNGITTVDLMVATHIDRCHVSGLLPVAQSSRITLHNFWGPSSETTQPQPPGLRTADERAYQRLYAAVSQRLRPEQILSPTREMALPELFSECTLAVLNPARPNVLRPSAAAQGPKKSPADLEVEQNELSMVLFVECHRLRILLGSDAEGPFWGYVASDPELHRFLELDILKVPNYGRPSGLPAEIGELLQTEYAVCSLGRDVDKQPSAQVVRMMQGIGAEVICTEHDAGSSFCRNAHCPAGAHGQNVLFSRCRGDASYSTSAYFCPLPGAAE